MQRRLPSRLRRPAEPRLPSRLSRPPEVSMFRRPAVPALALVIAAAALACAPVAALAKTLVYCSEGSPESFTPALNTTATSHDAARPLFDKLTQFARGTTRVEPGLAESWTVSPDGQ